jgi:hypothetical protein
MKNQFGTSGAGELPFVEVIPQLWVLNDSDAGRASELIKDMDSPEPGKPWVCPKCKEPQEAAFTHCWNCSAARPED